MKNNKTIGIFNREVLLLIINLIIIVSGVYAIYKSILDTAVALFIITVLCIVIISLYLVFSKLRLIKLRVNIKGIYKFYPKRQYFKDWSTFFKKHTNPEEVVFMGQSLSEAFNNKENIELFTKWCNEGTKFQILLLSPNTIYSQQLKNVSEGMIDKYNEIPQQLLKSKIELTIKNIEETFYTKINGDKSRKPLLRFSKIDLPFSMVMVDDEIIVTLYTSNAEANESPTFIIQNHNSESFKSFYNEFLNIWENHSIITPYKDPVLSNYIKDWNKYLYLKKSFYNRTNVNVYPNQAIIFPTYDCSNNCSFCMFQNKNKTHQQMPIETFKHIVSELLLNKVYNIEISGGGEPLEYIFFDEMVAFLKEMRNKYKELKIGLLTNGILLNDRLSKNILIDVFNSYIRISRFNEEKRDDEKKDIWYLGIRKLIELKNKNRSSTTKLGLKYLLTTNNSEKFTGMVKEDIERGIIDQFSHIRFKSERKILPQIIFPIEQEVYSLLKNTIKAGFKEKVSLSLPNVYYPNNFQCWISPIHAVFDPYGNIYECCHFSIKEDDLLIGNINENSFEHIWKNNHHIETRHRLSRDVCNCTDYCANCRFSEVQSNFEQIISTLEYNF